MRTPGTPSRYPRRPSGDPWADTLHDARLAKRMTQKQLAELLGVEVTTLVGWERGVGSKPVEKWRRWAKAVGYEIHLVKRGEQ